MSVSLIIPTFNRAHTLPRALDSVLGQLRPPEQVIVVDDASTDATAEILDAYQQRIELVSLPQNRGVSHARNVGIEIARGEWIALLDSDDTWKPTKLARQLDMVNHDPAVRALHTDELWVRNGRRVNPGERHRKPQGRVYTDCLPLCCVSPSAVLLHREVFDRCGLFDESLPACEDYDLWLRVFSRYPLALVDEPLVVKYGGHEDQLSRRYWGMDRFRVESLAKMLASDGPDERERAQTLRMLHEKCNILINGARKRGNQALLEKCQQLLRQNPLGLQP